MFFSEERPSLDLAVLVRMADVVALVVHAEKDIIVLAIETLVAF